MGRCMNVKKTELHALNAAPHFSFTSSSGTLVSTCDKNNNPHSFYKYLGVYVFVKDDPELLFQLLQSEIRTFFSNLQPLPLMLHELVLLYNIQLLPTLCYRMVMHSLPPQKISVLESILWQAFSKAAGISSVTCPKDRCVPLSQGGLILRHFGCALHKQSSNNVLRYLHHDSPQSAYLFVCTVIHSVTPKPLQDTFVVACHFFLLQTNGIGAWNVSKAWSIPRNTDIYTQFNNRFCIGRVLTSSATSSTLHFSEGDSYRTLDSHTFRQVDPFSPLLLPHRMMPNYLFPSPSVTQSPIPTSSAPPHSGTISASTPGFVKITYPHQPFPLVRADLLHWNCKNLHSVSQNSSSQDWWVYMEGSAASPHFGSGINCSIPESTFALASSSPLHSSQGTEFWALITLLQFLHQQKFSTPSYTHLVGDNKQVVDLLHTEQSSNTIISTHPQGSEKKFLHMMISELPPHIHLTFSWIKAHVGFRGNELAEAVPKCTAFCLPTPHLPHPPNRCVSKDSFPVLGKITTASTRSILPQHPYHNIYKSSSFQRLGKTFNHSKENCKWVTNTCCVRTHRPHYDMFIYTCPHCSLPHPMNPTSVVAICKSCTSVQSQFIAAWPHEVRHAVNQSFFDKATPGERTHFIHTTIPTLLLVYLQNLSLPSPLTPKTSESWNDILSLRSSGTSTAVKSTINWLHNYPALNYTSTKAGQNLWCSGNAFSTSFSPAIKRPLSYSEPEALPTQVSKKPKHMRLIKSEIKPD